MLKQCEDVSAGIFVTTDNGRYECLTRQRTPGGGNAAPNLEVLRLYKVTRVVTEEVYVLAESEEGAFDQSNTGTRKGEKVSVVQVPLMVRGWSDNRF